LSGIGLTHFVCEGNLSFLSQSYGLQQMGTGSIFLALWFFAYDLLGQVHERVGAVLHFIKDATLSQREYDRLRRRSFGPCKSCGSL